MTLSTKKKNEIINKWNIFIFQRSISYTCLAASSMSLSRKVPDQTIFVSKFIPSKIKKSTHIFIIPSKYTGLKPEKSYNMKYYCQKEYWDENCWIQIWVSTIWLWNLISNIRGEKFHSGWFSNKKKSSKQK